MKRRGIGAAFSDEDLEMLRSLWLGEESRAVKGAGRSSTTGRASKPRAIRPAADRRTRSTKKTDKDGPGTSSGD